MKPKMPFDLSDEHRYKTYYMGINYSPKQGIVSDNYSWNLDKPYLFPPETLNKSYIDGSHLDQRLGAFVPSENAYLNKDLGLVDRMATEKVALAKLTISQLANQLHEREEIKEYNLKAIDYESCRTYSTIIQINPWFPLGSPYDKRIANLERVLADLDKQKRDETGKFWKDTSDLKKDVVEALKEYRSAARTGEILAGELPGYGGPDGS